MRREPVPFPHLVRTVGFGGKAPEERWEGPGGRTWTVGSVPSEADRSSAVRSGDRSCHVEGFHWLPRIRWVGGNGRFRHVAFAPPSRSIDTVRATWQGHPTVEIDGFGGLVRNATSPTVETPIIDASPRPSTFHVTQHQHQPLADTTRRNDGKRSAMQLSCMRDRVDGPGDVLAGFMRARWNGRGSDGERREPTSVKRNRKKRHWTWPIAYELGSIHRGAGKKVRSRHAGWR